MGKISSYPSDANVTTSDRLIGSDNENSNETKNFEIGDIINLAESIIGPTYVPYVGATSDVFLGTYEINAAAGYFTTVYTTNINPNIGNPLIFIGGGVANGGVRIDTSANTYKFGDFDGNVNATSIQILDNQQQISFIGGFYIGNGEGAVGQVLTSNGAGSTPIWTSLPSLTGFVPYTGATANVDLGGYGITTSYLTSTLGMFIDGAISLNGDEGNIGEVLISQGPGATPSWSNALSQFVPYTGATGNVDLGTYNLIADNVQANIFQLNSGGILGLYGTVQLNGSPGTAGQVLTSSGGGVPTWTSLSGTYVPYTGATTGVNLGIYSLTAANVNANNFVPIVGGSGNTFFGGTGGYNNTQNGVYILGANTTILGNSSLSGNGTKIEIDDFNEFITIYNAVVDLSNGYGIELSNGQGSTGDILTSAGAGNVPSWNTIDSIIEMPFLSAYSDTTQNIVAANVGQEMVIHQTVQGNAISVDPNGSGQFTRITPNKSGMYNIQFSAQLRRTAGGSSQTVDIWLRKGGVNVPYSNTSVNVQANAGFLVAAWNFYEYIDVSLPNPYFEIMWASTDNTITMEAAVANAVHPATPSLIVTVNKVSN
jgi:hypothetical protein